MPLVPTEHLHSISVESFTHAKWTCPAPFIHVGEENVERCAWPHSSPMWSNGWGGKKSNAELNISTSCFFTRLFSSVYVTATVLFTVHRKAKQPMFLHSHVWFCQTPDICVFVFLQPASDGLSFCLFVYLRACVLVCLLYAANIFLYRHHGLVEPWVKD